MPLAVRASVRACLLCCAFIPFVLSATTLSQEYVCQDPDTGTIHELNTTWRSTTFCGNYTCKIRKINTNQPPSKVFVSLFNPQAKISTNDIVNRTSDLGLSKILPDLVKDSDRLLNQAEIKKITELLHSVKKSDLQAVVELYNVAQEIYKDMKESENKAGFRSSEETWEHSSETNKLKNSYWYTPANEQRNAVDMNTEGSEYRGTAINPNPSYSYPPPYFYSKSLTNYPSYFTGAVLNSGDFRKIGYNPQMTQQGLPSYYAQRSVYDVSGATEQSPCNPCARAYQYQMPLLPNYVQRPTNMYPYPFSYNYTAQNYNKYYKGNPWAFYDYYKNFAYPKPEPTADEKNVVTEAKEAENSWKTDPLSEEIINEIRANIAQRGKLINIPLKKRIKLERVAKVIKLNQNNRKARSIPNKVKHEDENSSQENVTKEVIKDTLSSQETVTKENSDNKVLSLQTLDKENIQEKLLGNKTATNLNVKNKLASDDTVIKSNKTDESSSLETVMNAHSKEKVSSQHAVTDVNSRGKATSLEKVVKVNSGGNFSSQEAVTKVDILGKFASQDTVSNVSSKDKATSLENVTKVNSKENVSSQVTKADIEGKLESQPMTTVTSKEKVSSRKRNTEAPISQENNEMLETYVEIVRCQPTTELGYFKIGNLTQPYPHCCPQKIADKER